MTSDSLHTVQSLSLPLALLMFLLVSIGDAIDDKR